MKKYDEYKDSDVAWIGEVPKHWEVIPLKFTGTFGNGLTYSPKEIVDKGILVLRSSNIQNSSLSFEDNVYVSKVPRDLLVNKGDIIICSRNGSAALVGKSAFVDKELNATFGAFMMRYIPNIEKKYGFYLFQTAIGQYKGYFSTTTINQLTKTTIGEIKIPLAMLEEQAAIATYLDTHCAKIDNLISIQQKRIALLQELKQSVITHAVTKGLNPNVEMKQSGVEWIGDVPKHWEVRRLKYITYMQSGETISPNDFNDDGKYPVFGGNGFRGYTDRYTNEGRHVLIGRQGALCGNINYASGRFYASEHAIVVYPLHDEDITWIGESMRACDFNRYSQTAAQPGIAVNNIKNIIFPYPSLQEQKQIAAYLNHKCATIDTSISNAQHQIELLQEYKQSLITEVVTGKRKVTDN